ncbi:MULTISPECIES: RecQ family ATP-dependent DNA helicase [Actinomyces]|uniref:DNA 3'-5' helicase n=1 Tax=Actinomyces respiraculi TaxID=2744574 RepID=A0A7T0PWD8_9ACTO|nr:MULTISPECIES: DEAD/DEAH box helicase [Actinomyces]QPL06291.1 RecQ family ATP-dependent DNA helicase [Actinomyces respiraculi]
MDTATAATGSPSSPVRERAEAVLRALVGRENARLREDQWSAIEALVIGRRRALVVQRTGWGKSAVYFVATVLLREGWAGWQEGSPTPSPGSRTGAGATVIVSPLLALMRDQVTAARRADIHAVTMNSANATEWDAIEQQVRAGQVDVLLVSPERLNNPVFRDEVLPHLAADAGLVVIDEAHCISDWGHDFRPDYRRIRTLLSGLPARTPVLATTATANARVTADVAEQLGAHGAAPAEPVTTGEPGVLVLRGSLERDSLHLAVRRLPDAAAQVSERLREAGLEVAAYTGQTDPAERERLEEELKSNRVKALVATSALGMGFDKPDLTFVVHVGSPASPVAYYQQVGRAGRGVDRAEVVLLPGAEDHSIWEWFGAQGFPPEQEVREVLAALEAARENGEGPMSTAVLETITSLRRTRLESMLKVLDVDGAVLRVRGGWVSTGATWAYDAERYQRVEAARLAEQDLMLAYEALEAPGCRMAFLRSTLDDPSMPEGWRCGACDLCGGLALEVEAGEQEVEAARASLARVGVVIEPRRQWPTGMERLGLPGLRGRIPEDRRASAGLAVGRLDGLGVSQALRELVEPAAAEPTGPAVGTSAPGATVGSTAGGSLPVAYGGQDGGVPAALREAAIEVAVRLGALAQPEEAGAPGEQGELVAVLIDSRTRPQLLRQLGNAVARTLAAPPLGIVSVRGEPGRHDVGSAFRLADVARSLTMENWSRSALASLQGAHVVLVDDWTDSGWTLTVAASLLREAGAASVHPFVLAQR